MKKGVSVVFLNNNSFRRVGALGLIMVAAGAAHAGSLAPTKVQGDARSIEAGRRLLTQRSTRFVENKGQWAKEARFLAKSAGLNVWYTDHGIRYDQSRSGRRQAVDMFFVGGHASQPAGLQKTLSQLSVYHGKLAVKGIGSYHELLSKDVLPGVSMRSYYDAGRPRYDLIVAPGAKAASIRMGFRGTSGLSVKGGELKIGTRFGGFYNSKPVAYQMIGEKRVLIAARWQIENHTAGFKLGAYDASRPLVIDPTVSVAFGTLFGADNVGTDEIRAVVKDPVSGAIIIAGSSDSPTFPSLPGQQPVTPTLNADNVDCFLTRFTLGTTGGNSTATDFSFLFGGDGDDAAQYLRVDAATGDVWVAGTTITANGAANSFPSSFKRTVNSQGNPVLVRDAIGDNTVDPNGGSKTNFFIARLKHLGQIGPLDFGKDAILSANGTIVEDASSPRYATVLGTGVVTRSSADADAFSGFYSMNLSGFDLRSLGDVSTGANIGRVQFAMTGVNVGENQPLSTSLIPNNAISQNEVDSGHVYPGRFNSNLVLNGFLLRLRNEEFGTNNNGSYFTISTNSSQYIESDQRDIEVHGVLLDAYGRAYIAGTVTEPGVNNAPNNIDTTNREATFRTTPNAITDANPSINGRLLRLADAFVRIYGDYDLGGRNSLEYSTLVGGDGDDSAGGIAASLAHTIMYTGAPFAVNSDGSIFMTGTVFGGSFPHKGTGLGNGFTPPDGTQQGVASDTFVVRIDVVRSQPMSVVSTANAPTSSSLPIAAVLGTTSRTLAGGLVVPAQSNFPIGFPALKSVEPAGLVLDKDGNVYITGNIRPYGIQFSTTYAITNEVTGSNASSIPITSNALDSTYDLNPTVDPTGNGLGSMPTTEAFLAVLKPDLSTLYFSSYVGGKLDDMLYAPTILSSVSGTADQVFLCGWTDSSRDYNIATRTSPDYTAYGDLPTAFVPNSYKAPDRLEPEGGNLYNLLTSPLIAIDPFGYAEWSTFGVGGSIRNYSAARDGFVSLLSGLVPTPTPITLSLTFDNASIDPLATATGTVTLNASQATNTRIRIDPSAGYLGRLKINGATPASTFYLTIPAASTSVTFPVQSLYYGSGLTANFTAYQVSAQTNALLGPQARAALTVKPLTFVLSLSNSSVNSGNVSETATVTLSSPAPLVQSNLSFAVTVPNTTANKTLFPNSTTYTPPGTTLSLLRLATVPITANPTVTTPSGMGAFTANATTVGSTTLTAYLDSPAPPSDDILTASTVLTVSPPTVTSITPSTTLVRSSTGSSVTFTIAFSQAPSAGYAVSFSVLSSSVFPSLATATFSDLVPTSNPKVFTITRTPVRVSRTQDVSITVNGGGTSASTSVTVIR